MALYEFEGKRPKVDASAFVFDSADVIGDVAIGPRCYVGPGARLRGDYGSIEVGEASAVEDNCVVHARPGERCSIGKNVTIGHGAILHNCTIKDWAIVGMGAVVSDYAVVGEEATVGEGAVVKNKQEIPARAIAVGIPAKVIGQVTDGYLAQWRGFKGIYASLAEKRCRSGLRKVG